MLRSPNSRIGGGAWVIIKFPTDISITFRFYLKRLMFFCGGVIECAFQEVNSNIILYWKCTSKYHPICCFDYLQHHHDMVGYIHYLPAWVLYVRLYTNHGSRWRWEACHRSPRSLTDLKLKYVTKKDLMSDSELKFRTTFVTHLLRLKSQSTLRAPPSAPPPVRWVYCIF